MFAIRLLHRYGNATGPIAQQRRGIACIPFHATKHLDPPPREFNPDGTPREYRLTTVFYNHDYHWERWQMKRVGYFHTVYVGAWAKEYPAYMAWYMGYPFLVRCFIIWAFFTTIGYSIHLIPKIGWYPVRFSKEYMQKTHELARVENCNPVTRYLDRRRRERGFNYLPEEWRSWDDTILANRPFGAPFSDKKYLQKLAEKEAAQHSDTADETPAGEDDE